VMKPLKKTSHNPFNKTLRYNRKKTY